MSKSKKKLLYELIGWIELPYYVGIEYSDNVDLSLYAEKTIKTLVRIRNDLLKIWTWNRLEYDKALQKSLQNLTKTGEFKEPEGSFFPTFVPIGDFQDWQKRSEEDISVRYIHVEKPKTILEFKAKISNPQICFSVVPALLPFLNNLADAYRIAALPAMRFEIHPITEANVNSAYYITKDSNGTVIQTVSIGIDTRSHSGILYNSFGEKFKIHERFNKIFSNIENLEPENQISIAYNLLHMRRWAEAVAVASAVVDDLTKQLIYKKAKKNLADLLWKKFRNRYIDIFNDVFPILNLPKLSNVNSKLWKDFCDAKKLRGKAVHSKQKGEFDTRAQNETYKYVRTFILVAEWLCKKLGRSWELSIINPDDGKLMDPIP